MREAKNLEFPGRGLVFLAAILYVVAFGTVGWLHLETVTIGLWKSCTAILCVDTERDDQMNGMVVTLFFACLCTFVGTFLPNPIHVAAGAAFGAIFGIITIIICAAHFSNVSYGASFACCVCGFIFCFAGGILALAGRGNKGYTQFK